MGALLRLFSCRKNAVLECMFRRLSYDSGKLWQTWGGGGVQTGTLAHALGVLGV